MFVATGSVHAADNEIITTGNMPERWAYTPEFTQQSPVDDKWWTTFDDVTLDSLISRGIDRNYDIASAMKRIAGARAAIGQARSGYFPQINASASWTKEQMSAVTTRFHGAHSIDDYFSLGVDMSWEVDIFGKVREGVKEKKAAYKATRAQYDGMMVSVAAQIADTYFDLRMYQEQLMLTRRHCEQQQKVLDIAKARMNAGLASMLDVSQARMTLYSTQATLPLIENNVRSSVNSLSVLLGEFPGSVDSLMRLDVALPEVNLFCDTCANTGKIPELLPDYHRIVAAGIPADLLRRRPDIVEAEAQVASYAALLGVAKKDFLPTLTINGSIGTSAFDAGDLFTHDSFTYSVTPTLSWTLFDGMSRKYEVTQARMQMESAIDSYNLTVLNAVAEVNNAMSSYTAYLAEIDHLSKVVDESRRSLDLSLDLYTQGLTEFSNVVDSQISLLQNQNSLIAARASALTSLVTLYKAMGGGWNY